MNRENITFALISAVLLLAATAAVWADLAPCSVVASGSATTSRGTVEIIGQPVIGSIRGATVRMRVGGLRCLSGASCLLGDVDGNGVIDGDDIDDYVRVVITGTGTPAELCAAGLSAAAFATLLLGP